MPTPNPFALISPDQLTVHPDVLNLPGLSDDELAALQQSILEHGVRVPLLVDDHHRVYDGRARLAAALASDKAAVPIVVRREDNVFMAALEGSILRRQLSRSAIAFLLFEQHPDLAAKSNKGGRPKKLVATRPVSGQELASFRDLAARYRVRRDQFVLLAEMREGMTPDEWAQLRHVVLFEEASIPRQYAGFKSGQPAGSNRGPVVYALVNEQGELEGILPRALSSVRQAFSRWSTGGIDTKSKAAIEKEWSDLLDEAPRELLTIAMRKAKHAEARA